MCYSAYMRLLDLFCGRWGWSRAFAARGWECVGIDLTVPPEIPEGCTFVQADILTLSWGPHFGFLVGPDGAECEQLGHFDFICASSPCEQFACFGMPHFQPNPPYPELGISLFNHTRRICEESGVPYVMENVRSAQKFVGIAEHHCGSFFLWGSAVPMLMPQGITKSKWTMQKDRPGNAAPECWWPRKKRAAQLATIPLELSSCVCDYAERILENV